MCKLHLLSMSYPQNEPRNLYRTIIYCRILILSRDAGIVIWPSWPQIAGHIKERYSYNYLDQNGLWRRFDGLYKRKNENYIRIPPSFVAVAKKKIVLNKRSLYGIDTSAFTNPLPRIMCPLLNIIWILANKLYCICNVQERIKAG